MTRPRPSRKPARSRRLWRRGENTDPKAGRLTFQSVAEDWLATRTRAVPDTVAKYRSLLENATKTFGPRRIGGITAADVGRFVTSLRTTSNGRPRRPAGIERIMFPVRAVFRYAVDEGYITRDPARKVQTPDEQSLGMEPFEGIALTPMQVAALAAECGRRHEHGELVVWCYAFSGLRATELSRLDLRDLNTLHHWLTARRTKNGRSRRADYSSALSTRIGPYLATHSRAGDPDAPLFYGRHNNGKPDPYRRFDPGTFYKRVFKPACRALGFDRVRLHDLRHTAGSWWLEAGISLETVRARLGHADINFTRPTYIHQLHTRVEEDARRLDDWFTSQLAPKTNVVPFRAAS